MATTTKKLKKMLDHYQKAPNLQFAQSFFAINSLDYSICDIPSQISHFLRHFAVGLGSVWK